MIHDETYAIGRGVVRGVFSLWKLILLLRYCGLKFLIYLFIYFWITAVELLGCHSPFLMNPRRMLSCYATDSGLPRLGSSVVPPRQDVQNPPLCHLVQSVTASHETQLAAQEHRSKMSPRHKPNQAPRSRWVDDASASSMLRASFELTPRPEFQWCQSKKYCERELFSKLAVCVFKDTNVTLKHRRIQCFYSGVIYWSHVAWIKPPANFV